MSGLRGWRLAVPLRRLARQWRQTGIVLAVAMIAATLVAGLVTLTEASEQGAVRSALAREPQERTLVDVFLSYPTVSVEEGRAAVQEATDELLEAPSAQTADVFTRMQIIPRVGAVPGLAYLGELDDLADNTELVEGRWPAETADGVEIAIPEVAAELLHLEVGQTIQLAPGLRQASRPHTIVGVFAPTAPASDFWDPDTLEGRGFAPGFPVPGTLGGLRTDAYGPFIVAPGTTESLGLVIERLVVRQQPDLGAATAADLGALSARLADAGTSVPVALGSIADQVSVISGLGGAVAETSAGVALTRSTVAVVGLMLVVIAAIVLGAAARLLATLRTGERHLMRSRGASRGQLLGLATGEALVIAVIAILVAPLLAALLYRLLATTPAMRAAGMPESAVLGPATWLASVALGLLVLVIVIGPSFGRDELDGARQERASLLQRTGLDLALLLLAGVAYWQLYSYSGVVGEAGSIDVDPVLAAGPALILLAGALASVRLLPLLARLAEPVASRSRGASAALAAWQVARRPQQAIATVLLLALTLGAGAFSQSFLATWRQAQLDQAAFALGAPVRVTAAGTDGASAEPAAPAGSVAPVARREAVLLPADTDAESLDTTDADRAPLLALSAAARTMLAQGRTGEVAGDTIATAIEKDAASVGPELPAGTQTITATVRVLAGEDLPGVSGLVRAVLEDEHGVLRTLELGEMGLDGSDYALAGTLPETVENVRLVGFQALVGGSMGEGEPTVPVTIMLRDLAAAPEGGEPVALDETDADRWNAYGDQVVTRQRVLPYHSEAWPYGIDFLLPRRDDATTSVATMGWPTVVSVPTVADTELAARGELGPKSRLTVLVDGLPVPVAVRDVVDGIPGMDGARGVLAIDATTLARALVQAGQAEPLLDEWWVDVPAQDQRDYLAALPDGLEGRAALLEGEKALAHPLRVATEASLGLVIVGAAVLAAVGLGIQAAGSLRARRLEFAQLRAVGLTRRALVRVVAGESLLLVALGSVVGGGLGVLLGLLLGPLVGSGAAGQRPLPPVLVRLPWEQLGLLVAVVALVYALVVTALAAAQRSADPAALLREGEER